MSSRELDVIADFIIGLGFEVDTLPPQLMILSHEDAIFEIEIKGSMLEIEWWAQYELHDKWIIIASMPLGDPNCFNKLEEILLSKINYKENTHG